MTPLLEGDLLDSLKVILAILMPIVTGICGYQARWIKRLYEDKEALHEKNVDLHERTITALSGVEIVEEE